MHKISSHNFGNSCKLAIPRLSAMLEVQDIIIDHNKLLEPTFDNTCTSYGDNSNYEEKQGI